MRNFQLLGSQNVTPLLHQIVRHHELWNQNNLRTKYKQSPHSQVDDIILRFQPHVDLSSGAGMTTGYVPEADAYQKIVDDAECVWYPAWDVLTEAHKLIFDLAFMVKAERIGRILISRMAPGKVIAPHVDGGACANYYSRYQMPLQSAPGCVFDCAGERVQMAGGEVWYFNNKLEHSVTNNSNTDRISLVLDLKTR